MKRSLGVLGIVFGFAVCLPLTEASGRPAVSAADRPVSELALKASQVGPGYRAQVVPGGRQVKGRVTLDLCGLQVRQRHLPHVAHPARVRASPEAARALQ